MEAAQILDRVVARFIGTKHERDIKKLQPGIAAINAREPEVRSLTDEGLKTRFTQPRAPAHPQPHPPPPAQPPHHAPPHNPPPPPPAPPPASPRAPAPRLLPTRHLH